MFVNGRTEATLQRSYEEAQKRIVALETDLQLAEQRVTALEKVQKEEDNGEIKVLREQLYHKSELLNKVKHLLSRAATNEKTLRQRVNILFVRIREGKGEIFVAREMVLILKFIMAGVKLYYLTQV